MCVCVCVFVSVCRCVCALLSFVFRMLPDSDYSEKKTPISYKITYLRSDFLFKLDLHFPDRLFKRLFSISIGPRIIGE